MAFFHLRVYERHIATYQVEAATRGEAITKLWSGDAEVYDDGEFEFEEIDLTTGIKTEDDPTLAAEVLDADPGADGLLKGGFIPGVYDVVRVNDILP